MSDQDPTGLRALIFGNRPIDEWPPATDAAAPEGEPWVSFLRARAAAAAGDGDEAISIWRTIADAPGLESRQVLQAWHFLRGAGVLPPAEVAKHVQGAVAEVAVGDGHDVLAAYADGSVRYLNVSGAAAVIDDTIPSVDEPARELLRVAQGIADAIGPWEEPELPPLPVGHTRLTVLTPSGPHLGQGPDDIFGADPMAATFLGAATALLVAVTDLESPS